MAARGTPAAMEMISLDLSREGAVSLFTCIMKLQKFSLNILKFIIIKEGNILPMIGEYLLTVSRYGQAKKVT
jgi:hypothetical protein